MDDNMEDVEVESNDDSSANLDSIIDVEVLKREINDLKQREEQWLREKQETEKDFSAKRARLMSLFKQKEDELQSEHEVAALLQSECDNYASQLSKLQNELDEYKSQIAVIECTRENEMDDEKLKVQQELASLHQLIRDTLSESSRSKKESEREIKKLKKIIEKLEAGNQELKTPNLTESSKEGVLSVMTKTLAKKVSGLNAYSQSNENIHENLEESMKKAQEDAEVLRSLVVPLEEEIRALKEKLRAADDKIQTYEGSYKKFESLTESCESKSETDADGKVKGLQEGLEAEKSSRSDLEMYVSVLQGQKATILNEAEDLRRQLRDVCHLLEKEKREHNELKQTWQMANDQFLEAQRIHAEDIKRMNNILTLEQQRVLAGMKRESREQGYHASLEATDTNNLKRSSPISFLTSPHRRKSPSPARLSTNVTEKSIDDKIGDDSNAEGERNKFRESVSSESDVGSDHEVRAQVVAGAEDIKRLPTEKEWLQFQDELKYLRSKISHSCDMCSNYETQLQKAQDVESELQKKIKSLQQSSEWLKNDLENERQLRKAIEEKFEQNSTEVQVSVAELYLKMGEAENVLSEQKQQFVIYTQETNDRLKELTTNREVVQNELRTLREENDVLMGKYLVNSTQLQNETINLPDTVSELQEMMLHLREKMITALTSKEHMEEMLRSEMLVMKERAHGEQQIRESTECMLMQEIETLRENADRIRQEGEYKLIDFQKKTAETQAIHENILQQLQQKLEETTKEKDKREAEMSEMRVKLHSLQKELDCGEAVQRDFVKLSQSLQVQLEGIRQSEEEVRWQHEEDVDECNNCKQPFSITKRKHHCRHCGRIFCAECISKVVLSGANSRPSKVCDVCHTLLVPSTAPYFSTEVPHGPE
ncbi:hypothetical protein CHUAL_013846 [Chamberlinius hualienensis]